MGGEASLGQGKESCLGRNSWGAADRSHGQWKGTRAEVKQVRLETAAAEGAEPEADWTRQRVGMLKGECAKTCKGQKAKVRASKRQHKT